MSAVGKVLERIGELESDLSKALRLVRRMAGIGEQGNLAEDARAYLAARQAPATSPGQRHNMADHAEYVHLCSHPDCEAETTRAPSPEQPIPCYHCLARGPGGVCTIHAPGPDRGPHAMDLCTCGHAYWEHKRHGLQECTLCLCGLYVARDAPRATPEPTQDEDGIPWAGRATPEPTQGTCKYWCGGIGTRATSSYAVYWAADDMDMTGRCYCSPACRDAGKALNPKAPL